MDPNKTLAVIRAQIDAWNAGAVTDEFDPDRLAEHVEALDEWMVKGGALPRSWDELAAFGAGYKIAVNDNPPF